MKEPSEFPDVRQYLNIHQYLQDCYAYLKTTRSSFSYDSWSQELGFRSRSFLRMVVLGKRAITADFAQKFCQRMQLDKDSQRYFEVLVEYCQCRSHEQKKIFGRQLIFLLKKNVPRTEIENHFEFLGTPFLPRLQTLLSFVDLTKTAKNLSEVMQVPLKSVEEGLKKLEGMGLAQKDPGEPAQWMAVQRLLKVPDQFGSAAMQSFHTEVLKEAIQSQNLDKSLRKLRSLIVPMSPEEFQSYLSELEDFVEQVLFKYQSDELKGRRLYQINFNLFPTTEKMEIEDVAKVAEA